MRVTPTELDGVLLIEPGVFEDERGFFLESYQRERYREAGIPFDFVLDGQSRSNAGTLRGLHYQEPSAQGKLVQVAHGAIFDVAVDIRRGSPNFGRWLGVELSGENHRQVWIPSGFAHGFLTLTDATDVLYKCTDYYAPQHEHRILWSDPGIGIVWPMLDVALQVSAKDAAGQLLSMARSLPSYGGNMTTAKAPRAR
jgi:dTDP-4-dehydrorhamnose 3,5-epimerase